MWKPDRKSVNEKLNELGLEIGNPVFLERTIEVPSHIIWETISLPGILHKYHPYCQSNKVFQWPGVGSRDGLTYYSGLYFERDFKTWINGIGYDLEIGAPPRKTSWISWRIKPSGEFCSKLSIEVTPYLESYLIEAVKLEFQEQYFGKSIKVYLDSLLRGVEYFITIGRVVQPKQFGSHSIYAP